MKTVFITTQQPNTKCGVVDYTKKLANALNNEKSEAQIEIFDCWSFHVISQIYKKFRNEKDIIFHLQYPTLGLGNSIAPAFLPLVCNPKKLFVTLHEFSVFNILRKLLFFPHALFSKKIAFTNDYERNVFLKFFPFAARKSIIIPLGSNITVVASREPITRQPRLIYFGQISEDKGLEFFIDTVSQLRANGSTIPITIMGSIIDKKGPIYSLVKQASEDYAIELLFNLEADDVSEQLQKSKVALLPFPDGITEKRGSALACLKHETMVITIHSKKTPQWMINTTYHAATPTDAGALTTSLLENKTENHKNDAELKTELALREWPEIAKIHLRHYSGVKT